MPGSPISSSRQQHDWPRFRPPERDENGVRVPLRAVQPTEGATAREQLRAALSTAMAKAFPGPARQGETTSLWRAKRIQQQRLRAMLVAQLLDRTEPPRLDLRIDDSRDNAQLLKCVTYMPREMWGLFREAGVDSVVISNHVYGDHVLRGLHALDVRSIVIAGKPQPKWELRLRSLPSSPQVTVAPAAATDPPEDTLPGPPPDPANPRSASGDEGAAAGSPRALSEARRDARVRIRQSRDMMRNALNSQHPAYASQNTDAYVSRAAEIAPSEFDTEIKTQLNLAILRGNSVAARTLAQAILSAPGEVLSHARKVELLVGRLPRVVDAAQVPTGARGSKKVFVPQLSAFVEEANEEDAEAIEEIVDLSLLARACTETAKPEQLDAVDAFVDEMLHSPFTLDDKAEILASLRDNARHPGAAAPVMLAILESQLDAADKHVLLDACGIAPSEAASGLMKPPFHQQPWAALARSRIHAGSQALKLMSSPQTQMTVEAIGANVTIEGMWLKGSAKVLCRSQVRIQALEYSSNIAPDRRAELEAAGGFCYAIDPRWLEPVNSRAVPRTA